MKNQLLIPLIAVGLIGLIGTSSMISLVVIKQNNIKEMDTQFSDLSSEYEALLAEFDNITECYDGLIEEYQNLTDNYEATIAIYYILLENNSDLQDELDILQATYNNLITNYNDLLEEYDLLLTSFNNLQEDYNTLQDEYDDLQFDYNQLDDMYQNLNIAYQNLQDDYNSLQSDYNILQSDFDALTLQYNDLLANYNDLQDELDAYRNFINQLILPAQYLVFSEAVRRQYMPLYLEGKTDNTYWRAFAEYCRDVVLHDSQQENSFQTVSNAFIGSLKYDSDTMILAFEIMYNTFYDWLPNWDGWALSGNEITDINTVHQWCVDEIEYEYDTDIIVGQNGFIYDYIKFPVETAFRTMGDCEDQAILDAAYLESCGFETSIAVFHDDAHPLYGSFYHGTLLVHIEDTTAFNSAYPSGVLWNFGPSDPYYEDGYTWCWLDPTWDTPFGSIPAWLQGYIDGDGISTAFCSIAICDIDGTIL